MKWQPLKYVFALLFALSRPVLGQPTADVLTNASEILALSADRALKGVPIVVRGVVTAAEKYWDGRFFVEDSSAGVFVDNIGSQQPWPGDMVEVSGISHPGAFAPVISKPIWRKLGTAALPRARPVEIERLVSGIEDGQRIEIAGTVRTAREEHSLLSADIVSGGYRFHVFAKLMPGLELKNLIGARVRVRGTAAPSFNAQLRQLITVKLFAPLPEDFMVEQLELSDLFNKPTLPLNTIAQYRKDIAPGTRVHVKGIVTHQRVGEDLFLMDDTGGLHIKSVEGNPFLPGQIVEAIGFPNLDHFLPVLEDAVCRETQESALQVIPKRATTEELQAGLHHADLITLRAKLLDRVVRRSLDHASEGMQVKTLMMFQSDDLVFSAQMESLEEPSQLVSIPLGSIVEVTGICLSEINEEGKLKLLKLLLPAGEPLRVLQTPSWLTPQRLSVSLAILFVVLVVAICWTVIISKNNSALNHLVTEKEQAQRQLAVARDNLEERVKQRTEQLKLQIHARKESEVQFKSVLTERTRLAQELHDTLEQTLTGIALQMDTAGRLVDRNPDDASQHLRLARSLVTQGQDEVRRSVWDLRSRSREEFDLPGALSASSHHLTDGTAISVSFTTTGRVRRLPDLIEDNLLRIAQEALTNVIKHAGQTSANIDLDYRGQAVFLTIRDQGKGFSPNECAGPLEGHFGLLGISERVKRIKGRASVHSAPGMGTTVRVEIPIEAEKDTNSHRLLDWMCDMKSNGKIRVLIADDHFVVRMGLIALVKTEPGIEVVAEASDGREAVERFAQCLPNLVLMDLRMPNKDGIQATVEIRSRFPDARILMLTTFDGDEDIHRALDAGAQGYVLKNSTGETLIPALRAVAAGQRWVPKEVALRLAFRKSFEELTNREVEVLDQLAKGLANKQIADVLTISEYTVKDHLKNILGKLRVADRTEAVTAAIQRGIIHL